MCVGSSVVTHKVEKDLIIGTPGKTRDHNFYMGTQNKIPTEKLIFDSHFYIKDTPHLEFSHMFVQGCNVLFPNNAHLF